MGLVEVIMEGSSLVKWERQKASEEGRAEGLQRGEVHGQANEARKLLRMFLADRFPGLESMPEIDQIAQVTDLETLLLKHAAAPGADRSSVDQAIRTAAAATSVKP